MKKSSESEDRKNEREIQRKWEGTEIRRKKKKKILKEKKTENNRRGTGK